MRSALHTAFGGLALAGLLAAPSFSKQEVRRQQEKPLGGGAAQGAAQVGEQEQELDLTLGSETISFRVTRGGAPIAVPTGAADARDGAGPRPTGAREELRFDLRAQAGIQTGALQLTVEVSRAGAALDAGSAPGAEARKDVPAGREDKSAPAAERGGALGDATTYKIALDADGRIRSVQKTGGEALLDEQHLRCSLAVILGSGLHAEPLERGRVYPIAEGASVLSAGAADASAGRTGQFGGGKDLALRFEGLRDRVGGPRGQDAGFTVLADEGAAAHGAALGAGRAQDGRPATTPSTREGERMTIGTATYSTADGLVQRFEVRPQPTSLQESARSGVQDDSPAAGIDPSRMESFLVERIAAR